MGEYKAGHSGWVSLLWGQTPGVSGYPTGTEPFFGTDGDPGWWQQALRPTVVMPVLAMPLQRPFHARSNSAPGCPEGIADIPIISVLLSSSLSFGVLQRQMTPPSSWWGPCCTGTWATSSPSRGKKGCLGRVSSWQITRLSYLSLCLQSPDLAGK